VPERMTNGTDLCLEYSSPIVMFPANITTAENAFCKCSVMGHTCEPTLTAAVDMKTSIFKVGIGLLGGAPEVS
jgi:hypothetical protein